MSVQNQIKVLLNKKFALFFCWLPSCQLPAPISMFSLQHLTLQVLECLTQSQVLHITGSPQNVLSKPGMQNPLCVPQLSAGRSSQAIPGVTLVCVRGTPPDGLCSCAAPARDGDRADGTQGLGALGFSCCFSDPALL